MAKKQKDNLRRGKRGNVPRFDYHVVFSNGPEGVHKFINNVKDVLILGWGEQFRLDSHILNKNILQSGEAIFKRRDSGVMLVVRTPKYTPDEMTDMYLSGDEAKIEFADNYLSVNPGLKRKVSPILKGMSKATIKLKQSLEEEVAQAWLNLVLVPGIELPALPRPVAAPVTSADASDEEGDN